MAMKSKGRDLNPICIVPAARGANILYGPICSSSSGQNEMGHAFRRPPATLLVKLCSTRGPGAVPRIDVLLPEMCEAPEEDV